MKIFVVILTSLLLTKFFGATSISNTLLLLALLPFVILEINEKSIFKIYIFAILLGIILNIISCYFYSGQSLIESFKASVIFFYIMFYFMLRRIKPSLIQMENALLVLVVILCICYIVQFLIYPVVIFSGAKDEYTDDIRIRLVAQGFSSIGYFWGLNNFLLGKGKIINILLALLCLTVIFLMGFRTMLAGIVFFSIVLVIRIYGFSWKNLTISLLAIGIFIALIQIPVFADKINYMLERQETQNFNNSDYIRISEFQYFTQNHFQNTLEYILGSGMPFEETSYGNKMTNLEDRGIYYDDWGLLGLSWLLGVIPVLLMIFYSIKAFILKVNKEHYYIGIWFLYLVFTSFTTAEFYREGNFVVQAIALYMVEQVQVFHRQNYTAKGRSATRFDIIPE